MGNQASKPPGTSGSPTATERHERERKVARRVSLQGVGAGKATAADPSASHASATAQNISQPITQRQIHEQLQAAQSPESTLKPQDRLARQTSRDPSGVPERRTPDSRHLEHRPKDGRPAESAVPMNVPGSAEKTVSKESGGHRPESPVPNYLAEYAKLQRPPRLPLPIAEVDHAPGSPLTEPVMPGAEDVSIFDDDDADLPRKSSMLSSTTVEDEDIGDELSSFSIDANIAVKVVPIVVEWKQPGDKVYVTGTFANWAKKYKLHRNKDGRGMSVALQLPPGTHHVKFIVDGEMKNSDHLPTAVDFNNVLVNYIEVSADDINRMRQDHTRFSPETPRPGVGQHEKQRPESPDYGEDGGPESRRRSLDEEEVLDSDYRQLVPQALVDIDRESDSEERNTAATILSEGQGPPTLPLFLGKSILNGVLPMKDDASVLTLPNHTVLNHLATSSIKNGVLATSVTTRYKKKYVTTIMYKPTGLEEKQKVRDEQLQQQREQREQQRKKSQSQEKPDQLQEIVEQQPQEPLQATEETEAEQQHKQDEQRPSEQV